MTWISWVILTALCAPVVWALIDTLRDHRAADRAADRAAEQDAAEKQRLTERAAQIRDTAVAARRENNRRDALDHLTKSDVDTIFGRIISHYDEDSHR